MFFLIMKNQSYHCFLALSLELSLLKLPRNTGNTAAVIIKSSSLKLPSQILSHQSYLNDKLKSFFPPCDRHGEIVDKVAVPTAISIIVAVHVVLLYSILFV